MFILSKGGIAGCGISLQYHPLLWWAGLRKVREKYHIYTYQWNCRIIKEICIKYNIGTTQTNISSNVTFSILCIYWRERNPKSQMLKDVYSCVQSIDKCKRMTIPYIILYANFFDNSAISNILISAMKQWWHYHSSLSWNCSWTLCFFSSNTRQWALN
jgi:hypothetical protein